jgi:hypothetical protein
MHALHRRSPISATVPPSIPMPNDPQLSTGLLPRFHIDGKVVRCPWTFWVPTVRLRLIVLWSLSDTAAEVGSDEAHIHLHIVTHFPHGSQQRKLRPYSVFPKPLFIRMPCIDRCHRTTAAIWICTFILLRTLVALLSFAANMPCIAALAAASSISRNRARSKPYPPSLARFITP